MASDHYCSSRTCKVCGCLETSLKMLICDQCKGAFHTSCCIPRIKRIPIDEWFCYSCLEKKRKILKEKSSSGPANISNQDELGPIADMLRDTEPFKSNMQVGQEYQVVVPDWFGPVIDKNSIREPEEITELEYVSLHGESNKTLRLSSIGHWLQCQEVIEGIGEGTDGTICGKWRRAPLFEVQADDCGIQFMLIMLSPRSYQQMEVLKQLKYTEMLRPWLDAKKQKLDQSRSVDSQDQKEARGRFAS